MPAIECVVPTNTGVPPTVQGVTPADTGVPSSIGRRRTHGYRFPAKTQGGAGAPLSEQCPTQPLPVIYRGVEQGGARIRPLAAAPSMQEPNMSVLTDDRLVGCQDDNKCTHFVPTSRQLYHKPLKGKAGITLMLVT